MSSTAITHYEMGKYRLRAYELDKLDRLLGKEWRA